MSARSDYEGPCALEAMFSVFASKWKPAILYYLFQEEVLRHGELRRRLDGISQRMLTQQLRALERDGLITRTAFDETPPRVEYRSTTLANSLDSIYRQIEVWGRSHMEQVDVARQQYDTEHDE